MAEIDKTGKRTIQSKWKTQDWCEFSVFQVNWDSLRPDNELYVSVDMKLLLKSPYDIALPQFRSACRFRLAACWPVFRVAVLRLAPVPVLRGPDAADPADAHGVWARVHGRLARRLLPALPAPQVDHTTRCNPCCTRAKNQSNCDFFTMLICFSFSLRPL